MGKTFPILLLLNVCIAFSNICAIGFDTTKSIISGYIKTNKDLVIEGANIVIQGSIDGASSDENGYFEFETEQKGKKVLIISALDFLTTKLDINIVPGGTLKLNIILQKEEVRTEEIIVTASSFISGENSKLTLTPLEIVRIPGADADLFRAITTFPGSNQVDEGSRIAVRGGDPSEVLTFIDYASVYNPFLFDDVYNTSSYSTVNPWGMKGISFSSGGFSAKFGNVLSAVLDLQTYDLPKSNGMFIILGLANASLSGIYASNDGNFGASFTSGGFIVKPLLEVNNIKIDYNPYPIAASFGGTLGFKPTKTSLLKVYADYNYDKLGIRNTSPTFDGYLNSKTDNYFSSIKYSFAPTSISYLNLNLSFSKRDSYIKYSIIDNKTTEIYSKIRADFTSPITQTIELSTGIEYEYNRYQLNGNIPLFYYNLKNNAPAIFLDKTNETGRIGAYTELKYRIIDNLSIISGIRTDYHTISKVIVFDPRLSAVYKFSDYSYLKAATGIYHQNPSLEYFSISNSTDIKPEQAIHYILGYEFNKEGDYIARLEGFYKSYRNLLSFNYYSNNNNFNFIIPLSEGSGFARGIDVFLKYRLRGKFNGWISYSYLDSKRKQYDATSETSANYDITHTLNLVASYSISDMLTVGISYKISTGKPYTPIIGGILDTLNSVYIPIYAERNSNRMPTYHRLDMNLQYILKIFNRYAFLFFSFNNVLNNYNLYSYSYNFDYTKKFDIRSDYVRAIYFGFGIQL